MVSHRLLVEGKDYMVSFTQGLVSGWERMRYANGKFHGYSSCRVVECEDVTKCSGPIEEQVLPDVLCT